MTWCPNMFITSGCIVECGGNCRVSEEDKQAAILEARAGIQLSKDIEIGCTARDNLLSVTKTFFDKIDSTKDLKSMRKWPVIRELRELLDSLKDELPITLLTLLKDRLPLIRNRLQELDGFPRMREDLWRRLLWVEILMGMHPELL